VSCIWSFYLLVATVNLGSVLAAQQTPAGTGAFAQADALYRQREDIASARQAAEQFAKDSASALGGIRQATQGYFSILPRDQAPGIEEAQQRQKIVRVVTTVE